MLSKGSEGLKERKREDGKGEGWSVRAKRGREDASHPERTHRVAQQGETAPQSWQTLQRDRSPEGRGWERTTRGIEVHWELNEGEEGERGKVSPESTPSEVPPSAYAFPRLPRTEPALPEAQLLLEMVGKRSEDSPMQLSFLGSSQSNLNRIDIHSFVLSLSSSSSSVLPSSDGKPKGVLKVRRVREGRGGKLLLV